MGTLSLIFGIILIFIGLAFGITTISYYDFLEPEFLFGSGITVIVTAVGAGLIIKYDNDKKKEKNS